VYSVKESDWKLFRKLLPKWQERFMESLLHISSSCVSEAETSRHYSPVRINGDTCQHVYRIMGDVVANAFSVGKELT